MKENLGSENVHNFVGKEPQTYFNELCLNQDEFPGQSFNKFRNIMTTSLLFKDLSGQKDLIKFIIIGKI